MAVKKIQKTEEQKVEAMTYNVEVLKIREIKDKPDNYRIDLMVNGVKIYGCRYVTYTGKEGVQDSFIAFPSYKGSDDKWYDIAWFPVNRELLGDIEKKMEAKLNE